MLPEINLDNENFNEIVEDAKKRIHTLYPEWSDYNYHDPGITLIELFAWLKEIQQYKANQTGDIHKLVFLELLGMKPKHRKEANTRIYIEAGKNITLPRKSRFYAGEMVFENVYGRTLLPIYIPFCILEASKKQRVIPIGKLSEKQLIRELVFTDYPAPGNTCYISFSGPLPIKTVVYLGVNLYEDQWHQRKPLERDIPFKPLAELEYEYYSKGGWEKLTILKDDTFGFLFDGNISFVLETEMEETSIFGMKGYYIRICLKEGEFEIPPKLTGLCLNMLELRQQETWVENSQVSVHRIKSDWELEGGDLRCGQEKITVQRDTWLSLYGEDLVFLKFHGGYDKAEFHKTIDYKKQKSTYTILDKLGKAEGVRIVSYADKAEKLVAFGEADGLPGQSYDLEDEQISYPNFEILIGEEDNRYYEWEKVEAIYESSPLDRHYILDEEKACILFGDGINGKIPKGTIYIISYSRTLGSKGNVKPDTIKTSGYRNEDMYIYHEDVGSGGMDTEELEHTFKRFRKKQKEERTLICTEDFERAVMNIHGLLIENCRGDGGSPRAAGQSLNQITLVVKPKTNGRHQDGRKIKFGRRYEENILSYLEGKRMLGTKVSVVFPEYIGILLYGEVIANPYCRDGGSHIRQVVLEYFKNQEKKLEGILYYSRIYGLLDGLPEVLEVKSLLVTSADGSVRQNPHGDLLFSGNQIPELTDFQLDIRIAGEDD